MSSEALVYFDQFSKLPPNLVRTAQEVNSFAAHFVKLGDPKSFEWQKFLTEGINEYNGDDLVMDKFQSNTINQQDVTVEIMVDKMVAFLKYVLSVVLSEQDIAALTKHIEATFTDLKTAKDNGWADFTKSSSSQSSSWEYRLQLAFPNPDLPDSFYILVTTVKLETDIQSWVPPVTSSTRANFSATIDAVQLIVMEGFRDPRKGAGPA
ncbi:hypothetical protein VNI00_002674 [Paramarasmius palmivorus]|uniref:Delta-endotoxin CytB n=1 Tax=Paramarasmius palmivorus TaxID=297713 RepID=A0AAW0DXW6_9AGAR